ncbi:hypothetical protein CN202_34460 [Sinorhizobium meliloti]|nr:hypothetical protein CN202_34460 [Sinorhizobium meliloti]
MRRFKPYKPQKENSDGLDRAPGAAMPLEGNHLCCGTFRFQGAHRRRSAMRTAERVKVIEWIATFACVASLAALLP